MKATDIDLAQALELMDRINAQGCNYANLQITTTGKSIGFVMYTPETGHAKFEHLHELIEHMANISSCAAGSIRMIVAKEKAARISEQIDGLKDDLVRQKQIIAEAESAESPKESA